MTMPSKKQTRRAISVKGLTYQRLKNYADRHGLACSGILEQLIHEKLDREGEPMPKRLEVASKRTRRTPEEEEEFASAIFTF